MTYKELLEKINDLKPNFTITNHSIARTFMTQSNTVKEWEKNDNVPDAYIEHINNILNDWAEFNKVISKKV